MRFGLSGVIRSLATAAGPVGGLSMAWIVRSHPRQRAGRRSDWVRVGSRAVNGGTLCVRSIVLEVPGQLAASIVLPVAWIGSARLRAG